MIRMRPYIRDILIVMIDLHAYCIDILLLCRNVNQGGRIIYEPDENDDWDDEDPDDDLDI